MLVSPPAGLEEPEARGLAYGAWDVLDGARTAAGLPAAVAPATFVVATSGKAPGECWTPRELARRRLRPSRVATGDRTVTQRVAVDLFEEGIPGFAWWSTIEASWSNVTLFAERAVPSLRVDGDPEPLTLRSPSVREAADAVGIRLAG